MTHNTDIQEALDEQLFLKLGIDLTRKEAQYPIILADDLAKFRENILALFSTLQSDLIGRVEAYEQIFAWLLGENGDFPVSEPGKRYGFRTELRKRLSEVEDIRSTLEAMKGKL